MPDSKLSALTEISVPNLEDLVYLVDDPSGTPVSAKVTIRRLLGQMLPRICDGRLTTETGVAISTSDRASQSTLYFTPYIGKNISLYDGTRWRLYSFSEVGLALSGLTADKNYDVFLYDNSGTLTLELSAAWTNDTTRADALTTQDGIYVKSGATTRRYLGTIRTTGATTTEDSKTKRFVWNYYNRVLKFLQATEATDSWVYNATTWRAANASNANRLQLVQGFNEDLVKAEVRAICQDTALGSYAVGVGVDRTDGNDAQIPGGHLSNFDYSTAIYKGYPGIGFHFLQWVEYGSGGAGSTVFYGDGGSPLYQSSILGEILQ